MALWVIGTLVAIVVTFGLALQIAIWRNGPAVLSAVDRVTGGARDTKQLARISTGEHPQQKLVVWGPEKEGHSRNAADSALPVLVFAHGGSWAKGDPDDYGFVARAFVPEGFIVVLVGYRLGEDGRYPAMLEDTATAIAWTRDYIDQYGGDPDRIVLAGHSAGAYNVVQVALEPRWLEARGASPDAIAGVIGLAGPYDFAPFDSESTIATFGQASDAAATQPVNHVRSNGPPMLLVHGEEDTLVRPRNSRVLAERMEQAGGHATLMTIAGLDHNSPLIHHAAPWRRNAKMIDMTAGFALAVTAPEALAATKPDETSVPVQDETR
ncbi:MAG: alpha/beta hydrolase [Pseudomonadota bacterium]